MAIRHKHIVRYVHHIWEEDLEPKPQCNLYMELCENGDLSTYIENELRGRQVDSNDCPMKDYLCSMQANLSSRDRSEPCRETAECSLGLLSQGSHLFGFSWASG